MKVNYKILMTAILLIIAVGFNFTSAAEFEGVVTMRTVSMATYDLPGAEELAPSLASIKAFAQELFKKPVDQIAAMGKNSEEFVDEQMKIRIKGGKIRMDIKQMGQNMSAIFNSQDGKMYNVMWDSKMVMVIDPAEMKDQMKGAGKGMEDMFAQMEQMSGKKTQKYEFKMAATGQTKTINGFKTTQFAGNSEEGEYIQFWLDKNNYEIYAMLTKAFEGLSRDLQEKEGGLDSEEKFLMNQKAIPILRCALSAEELEIQELVAMERKSLPATDFEIPANFKTVNMQEMMRQQMQQMMQGGQN